MIEILFRGKAIEEHAGYKIGDWVYGNFIEGVGGINDCYINPQGTLAHIKVDCNTVGQYIGKKDINGIRIFEKDILINEYKHLLLVYFNSTLAAFVATAYNHEWKDTFICGCKIIGNEHDNPELINQRKY